MRAQRWDDTGSLVGDPRAAVAEGAAADLEAGGAPVIASSAQLTVEGAMAQSAELRRRS
jgi:hypothetical protein